MTLLRVVLPDAPRAGRADAWALVDDSGRLLREGRDVPAAWPTADRREAVLAAARTRVTELVLPPMPPDRLPAAVMFALEDRLAPAGDPPRVAIGRQHADGSVEAAIAAGDVIDAIARAEHRFTRIVPEASLTQAAAGWTWYASADEGGFVRTPAGVLAVGAAADLLPGELAAALAQASHAGQLPAEVRVAFAATDGQRSAWSQAANVAFIQVAPWRSIDASPARYAQAPDWLAVRAAPGRKRAVRAAAFRPALVLAVLAVALHIGGTLAQWAAARIALWRVDREVVALARSAGIEDVTTASAATAALVRRDAEARHRAGQLAPADALPLLARAAAPFATLPPGAMKAATYGTGAWTLELAKLDSGALAALDRALTARGVAVLQASTAAGTRLRITSLP